MDIDQLRAAYDLVAPEYASRFASELSGKPFDRKMLDWFAERVGGSGSILDVGCGPGQLPTIEVLSGDNVTTFVTTALVRSGVPPGKL